MPITQTCERFPSRAAFQRRNAQANKLLILELSFYETGPNRVGPAKKHSRMAKMTKFLFLIPRLHSPRGRRIKPERGWTEPRLSSQN